MNLLRIAPLALVAALAVVSTPPARAAEAYDNCTGTLSVLPAVIALQGTWCLKSDLATAIASGVAIEVNANNVIIDCNGFKLGGLQAGLGTQTTGIRANLRANTTIRNCTIRGFQTGADLHSETGGYVVEDNRFDGNTDTALRVNGSGSRIQRNQILHTGRSTAATNLWVHAIQAQGTMDIVDNQIHDVSNLVGTGDTYAMGIRLDYANGGRINDNVISGVERGGPGNGYGIYVYEGVGTVVRDNEVTGMNLFNSHGIECSSIKTIARGNTDMRDALSLIGCTNSLENFVTGLDLP